MNIIDVFCYYINVDDSFQYWIVNVNGDVVSSGLTKGHPLNMFLIFGTPYKLIKMINKKFERNIEKTENKPLCVDCFYNCDTIRGITDCSFVERRTKRVATHIFKTLNIYDIAKTDFCSDFSSICFINKEITEKDLIDEKTENKPLDVICCYICDYSIKKYKFWFFDYNTKKFISESEQDVEMYKIPFINNDTLSSYFKVNVIFAINQKVEKQPVKTDEISKLEDRIEDLIKTNDELKISYSDLVARANHYIQENADAQNKLQSADKKIEILIKENKSLREMLKNTTEKANKYRSDVVLKNDELDYVSCQYKNLQMDAEKLEKKNEELREREKKYCASHESILKDRNSLRTERDKAISDLGDDINNYKNQIKDLEMEIASKTIFGRSASDIKAMFELNQSLKDRIYTLEIDNKSLIDSLSRNGIDKLILDLAMFQKEADKLRKEVEDLKSKTVLEGSTIISLVERNNMLFVENKSLNKKIKDFGNILQTININDFIVGDLMRVINSVENMLKDNK